MKTEHLSPKAGHQLWGIYHRNRDDAHQLGDPLRTVIEAPTELAAEELAARFGFSDPQVRPVTPQQASQAQWLPIRGSEDRVDP